MRAAVDQLTGGVVCFEACDSNKCQKCNETGKCGGPEVKRYDGLRREHDRRQGGLGEVEEDRQGPAGGRGARRQRG